MKKPFDGSTIMDGPNGPKAFAKKLVSEFSLELDTTRFSVVSFAEHATTRVSWSYNASEINEGIDNMKPKGKTSISGGFEAVQKLFNDSGREGATKIVLLLSPMATRLTGSQRLTRRI